MRGKAKKKRERKREEKEMKGLSGFVSPGKISYSDANAKMCAIIRKKSFSFWGTTSSRPFSRALENFCFPDPVTSCVTPPNLKS